MGTRAVIKRDGKLILTTHWDSNPANLGVALILAVRADNSIDNIIKVATKHSIDFADKSVCAKANLSMIAKLKKENKYSEESPDAVEDIEGYDDFAEWDYDIRGREVFVARRYGEFSKNKVTKYKKLMLSNAKQLDSKDAWEKIDPNAKKEQTMIAKMMPKYIGFLRVYDSGGKFWQKVYRSVTKEEMEQELTKARLSYGQWYGTAYTELWDMLTKRIIERKSRGYYGLKHIPKDRMQPAMPVGETRLLLKK